MVTLGLVAAVAAGGARADTLTSAVLAYDTAGSTIGTTGMTYSGGTAPTAPPITLATLAGATFMSPSTLSLGLFQTSALASGQSVTYSDTPFDIKFKVDGVNGSTSFSPNQTPIDITGVLNGTLSGSNQSSVVAKFNAPTTAAGYTFATDQYTNTLSLAQNPISLVPSSTNNGDTSAQAVLSTAFTPTPPIGISTPGTVPEPSTIVLFAATIAGLGLRRRLRRD